MIEPEAIVDYATAHSDAEGDYLYRLWRATNIHTVHGHMASGHLQGRLLKMLVMMLRPRTILEVGTFSGYSAICMAEGLKEIAESDNPSSSRELIGSAAPLPEGEGRGGVSTASSTLPKGRAGVGSVPPPAGFSPSRSTTRWRILHGSGSRDRLWPTSSTSVSVTR